MYRRHADAWVARRSKRLFERNWLDRFLALMPDAPLVLDLGCGAGQPVARYLLGKGCALTGVDTSPRMLERAQADMPQARWVNADMRGLELDARFHGILAWNSFFHLTPDDQRKMFQVFKRYAAAGAALMFTSGPSYGEVLGELEGEVLYHASLDASEYEDLLDKHGFELVDHRIEDPDCGGHTVWLARGF
ncbi:class I SAM-dependent methyltransferase [Ruegeria sp. ANG-R]|uniref:class I SAM-dependent methyltransferase n=1 Tax=Ruegeria sp. ANG-R TaxID=1577903 RepID=UPI000B001266|nr:class I SAM-dependent methyltransferase [Ruegeria sp. ANG-R]